MSGDADQLNERAITKLSFFFCSPQPSGHRHPLTLIWSDQSMASSPSKQPWLKAFRLFGRPQPSRRDRRGRTTRRRALELLEDRTLLASNWTALTNPAPNAVGTMMLLTNGTVMAQEAGVTNTWYLLTPDSSGSYVNGTWSTLAPMGTQRLYFGSNVMQNGNVFVQGGEYSGPPPNGTPNDNNTGEIYNSTINSWSPITTFPRSNYGDDPSMLLPNGNILAGYLAGPQTYIYNIATNTWTQTGTKNNSDPSDEEGWVKLPDNSILSYDVWYNTGKPTGLAQRYIPSLGQWVNTGAVPVALSNTSQFELGPNALLPNGDVFQVGGNSNTALFNPSTDTNSGGGTWRAGPVIPGGYVSDDAPGVLLPNGQFLFTADHPGYKAPTHVFDYNYVANTITDITPTVANGDPASLVSQLAALPSYTDRFLMLPNGQALFTAGGTSQIYVYTGTGPVVTSATPSIAAIFPNTGNSYILLGSALNGASQGATYGDDAEMDTNYPIVSVATDIGTIYYARTTNWNNTGVGVANGSSVVNFSLPAAISSPPSVTAVAQVAGVGQPLNNVTVATFTDPNGMHVGQYAATISWGDGTPPTIGVISGPNGSGVYTVSGSHTYTKAGPVTLTVTVVDNYASGNLTVSASGISSSPTAFTLSGAGSTTFSVTGAPAVIRSVGVPTNIFIGTLADSQTQTQNPSTKGRSASR
jgi:hypothetical protein